MSDTMAQLSAVQQKFVLHWGEMGTRWGINRSVAQIHALLYLAARPLPAEEIALSLGIARSNVSTSLRELQGWGIIKRVHVLGDKRDHFVSLQDVWEMFRTVLDERKKRELDPTLAVLRECLAELAKKPEPHTEARLRALHDFFQTAMGWYEQVRRWPVGTLARFFKRGGSRP